MNPLDLIPRWALLLAVVGASALAGVQSVRLAGKQADHAKTKAEHAAKLQALAERAREAEQAARAEEQRRTSEVQKAAHEADQARLAAEADAAAARDAGQRLRAQLAALAAGRRSAAASPGVTGPGPAADATSRLLADVQRRLDEAADRIAEFADQSRIAGLSCERAYDSLTRR